MIICWIWFGEDPESSAYMQILLYQELAELYGAALYYFIEAGSINLITSKSYRCHYYNALRVVITIKRFALVHNRVFTMSVPLAINYKVQLNFSIHIDDCQHLPNYQRYLSILDTNSELECNYRYKFYNMKNKHHTFI